MPPHSHLTPVRCRQALGFFVLLSLPGLGFAEIPAEPGWPAQKVVDIHTHVFNARDLPLAGILGNFNVPWPVNAALADILRFNTATDDTKEVKSMPGLKAMLAEPRLAVTNDQRGLLEGYIGTPVPELLKSYRAEGKAKGDPFLSDAPEFEDAVLVAQALQKAGFPPGEAAPPEGEFADVKSLASIRGYLRFVGIMTSNHRDVANFLRYSAYGRSDLFVHHMMDLEKGYDDRPANPFPEQILQVQKVDETHGGVFAHFVAFDPFRRGDALKLLQEGIAAGGIGIKFYPPSGYRAAQNFFPKKPGGWTDGDRWESKYGGWKPTDLDAVIDRMFAWAEAEGIPVFTHCTPYGFQGFKGYGMRADPYYWGQVLKKHPKLRLCFGHGGGEMYWFSNPADDSTHTAQPPVDRNPPVPNPDLWLFGKQVVDLALQYPHVYFDVAYLEGILHQTGADEISARLARDLSRTSSDGTWSLGERILYGSDWHQLHKEDNYEKYLAAWDQVIRQVDGGKWRKNFFATNALNYLQLGEQAKRPVFAQQAAYWIALETAARKP